MAKQVRNITEDSVNATPIVTDVKTLIIVAGVIISTVGTLFGILQSEISSTREDIGTNIDKINQTQQQTNKDIKELIEKLEVRKVDPLDTKVDNIDKQVYFLSRRTNSRYEDFTNSSGPATSRMDTTGPN